MLSMDAAEQRIIRTPTAIAFPLYVGTPFSFFCDLGMHKLFAEIRRNARVEGLVDPWDRKAISDLQGGGRSRSRFPAANGAGRSRVAHGQSCRFACPGPAAGSLASKVVCGLSAAAPVAAKTVMCMVRLPSRSAPCRTPYAQKPRTCIRARPRPTPVMLRSLLNRENHAATPFVE